MPAPDRPQATTAKPPNPAPGTVAAESTGELRLHDPVGAQDRHRPAARLSAAVPPSTSSTGQAKQGAQPRASRASWSAPVLALLCARAAGGWAEAALPVAVMELAHKFSVLHDDVMDTLRAPSARTHTWNWPRWPRKQAAVSGPSVPA